MYTDRRLIQRRGLMGVEIQIWWIIWWETNLPPFQDHLCAGMYLQEVSFFRHVAPIKTIKRWIEAGI